jgi:hypothetical protein
MLGGKSAQFLISSRAISVSLLQETGTPVGLITGRSQFVFSISQIDKET